MKYLASTTNGVAGSGEIHTAVTARIAKIVWAFMIGATLIEGWFLVYAFHLRENWLRAAFHYAVNPPGTAGAWCLAALIAGVYVAYGIRQSPVIRHYAFRPDYWGPFAAVRLVAIVMAIITGYFEELVFRKIFMDYAMTAGYGVALQILFSAVSFGAVHAIWGIFAGKLRAALAAMVATGLLGALLAIDYIMGARSLAPCSAAHIAINLIMEPWLIMTAASGSWGMRAVPASVAPPVG
jgi:hypothetical protein